MRSPLRQLPVEGPAPSGGRVVTGRNSWSFLGLGPRRPPLGRRLTAPAPGRAIPTRSEIVLRAGSVISR
jgi:hypothetical protein